MSTREERIIEMLEELASEYDRIAGQVPSYVEAHEVAVDLRHVISETEKDK